MSDWLLWLIAAGVLTAAEMTTMTLVLVMIAGGAAAAAVTAAVGGPVVLQLLVAVVVTLALLGVVRPIAQRHLRVDDQVAITGAEALVGMQAVVLSAVDGMQGGRIRLNGAEWSARSYEPEATLAAGSVVRVIEINGATAVVMADPGH